MSDHPTVAVIGCGYWGARHVRAAYDSPLLDMALAVDVDADRLTAMKRKYKGLAVSRSFDRATNKGIDAVILATPISTHFSLAKAALQAGKHVLVEKPMAMTSAECRELNAIARERALVLMVGHTYEYHPAVLFIQEVIRRGDLGQLYSIETRRLNLGLFQPDSNVLWDLAPHDLSILFLLVGGQNVDSIGAVGRSHIIPGVEDVVHARIEFCNGLSAHLHVSWLDPVKVRQLTIVGSEGMLVFDDVLPFEKVRLYDMCFKPKVRDDTYEDFRAAYHHGDVHIPRIPDDEPLSLELLDFANAIVTGGEPRANGHSGLRVVEALEQASRALRSADTHEAAWGADRNTSLFIPQRPGQQIDLR